MNYFAVMIMCLGIEGCTTLKEKVSRDTINACFKLCSHRKGLDSIVINGKYRLPGELSIESEVCVCKNSQALMISPVYDYTEE